MLTLQDYRLIVAHDMLAGGGDTRTIQRADLERWRKDIEVTETELEHSFVLVADDADTIEEA